MDPETTDTAPDGKVPTDTVPDDTADIAQAFDAVEAALTALDDDDLDQAEALAASLDGDAPVAD